jgi:iron-sulfur cluster repair protein YtfE (RIC family)
MTGRIADLHRDHEQLREQSDEICDVARTIAWLDDETRERVRGSIVAYLRERIVPHTWIDERVLYPEVVERMGDPLVTVSMNYDHLAIRRWIDDIAEVDVRNAGKLQELLYGLHALIVVHTWKEDELYLKALDSSSWPV